MIARIVSKLWEPLLIGALLFGGWQLAQRLNDKTEALQATQETLTETREQLATVTREKRRVSDALAKRERTLHALQTSTESARSALRAAPDDGCLDRDMPADVIRLFQPPNPHRVGALMQPGVVAAPAPDPATGGAVVASSGRLHADARTNAGHERGGQSGGPRTLPGG